MKKRAQRVSVIIPTLNEESYLPNCLGSILNQTEKPYEVIVIDNGSEDNTLNVALNLEEAFKNAGILLRIYTHAKGNQTNARGFGVKKAKGEIIASLDADAQADSDWIEKIQHYMIDDNLVGIGGMSRFRNRGTLLNLLYKSGYYGRLVFGIYCLGGGNSAFRKSAFISLNGYSGLDKLRKEKNILYPKDDFFLSKKLEKKGIIKFCPDMNVSLFQRTRQNSNYKRPNIINMLKRLYLEIVYDFKIKKHFKKWA